MTIKRTPKQPAIRRKTKDTPYAHSDYDKPDASEGGTDESPAIAAAIGSPALDADATTQAEKATRVQQGAQQGAGRRVQGTAMKPVAAPVDAFTFSVVQNKKDTKPVAKSLTWNKFVARIANPDVRNEKDGKALILATFKNGTGRRDADVDKITGIGLDLDKGNVTRNTIEQALNGYRYVAYRTFSSKPGEERWRVFVPFAKPVEPTRIYATFDFFNAYMSGRLDPACKNPSRLMYTPACKSESREHFTSFVNEGKTFDASAMEQRPLVSVAPLPDVTVTGAIPQRVLAVALHNRRLRQHLDADPAVTKPKDSGYDRSALDWSLACLMGRLAFHDDEIAATLVGYGHGQSHKLSDRHVTRDIARMRAELGPQNIGEKTPPVVLDAAALQQLEVPPIRWVIPRMLPQGLAILAGRPKQGKSRIALNISLGLARGGAVLGAIKVGAPCGVLMLALEDSHSRLKQRMTELMNEGAWPSSLHFAIDWPRGDIAALKEHVAQHPDIGLIVIDTLGKWKPAPTRNSNAYDYDADVLNLSLLKRLADELNIAVLLIHHTRKSTADHVIDEISGTQGVAGTADTLWVMKRDDDDDSKTGTLYITGRDVEQEAFTIEWDQRLFSWKLLGKAMVRATNARRGAFTILAAAGDKGMRVAELAHTCNVSHQNASKLLAKLRRDGLAVNRKGCWYAVKPATNGEF